MSTQESRAAVPLYPDFTARSWWVPLILGVVGILAGIAVLVWPGITLIVLAVFVGVWLLVAGVARIVGAFLDQEATTGQQVLGAIVGLLSIVAGVIALRNPGISLLVLVVLASVGFIMSGVADLVIANEVTDGRGWLIASGILAIIAGILVLVWPGISLAVLVILFGINTIILGTLQVWLAFQLRKRRAAV